MGARSAGGGDAAKTRSDVGRLASRGVAGRVVGEQLATAFGLHPSGIGGHLAGDRGLVPAEHVSNQRRRRCTTGQMSTMNSITAKNTIATDA